MRRLFLKCRPTCANASCALLWHAATLRHVTPKTWRPMPTVVDSLSMATVFVVLSRLRFGPAKATCHGRMLPSSTTNREVTIMAQPIQREPAFLRRKQVETSTGLSRSTIYQYIKEPGQYCWRAPRCVARHGSRGRSSARTGRSASPASRALRAALAILSERGRARMEQEGRRRVVAINPALLVDRE